MLHTVVLENENAGIDTLAKHYTNIIPGLCVNAKLSLKEVVEFFSENDSDTIFNNVLLENGFDIFNKANLHIPVVFITPENNFMMALIGINRPNFLSLCDDNKESQKSTRKISNLQKLFLNNSSEKRKKTRLLVKRGVATIPLLLNDIAALYIKNRLVQVVDHHSKKYSIDKTLTELEEELDKSVFFRANRQYIININFVKSFKTYQKVKLLVDIDVPELDEPVIISQVVAPAFKKWMEDD